MIKFLILLFLLHFQSLSSPPIPLFLHWIQWWSAVLAGALGAQYRSSSPLLLREEDPRLRKRNFFWKYGACASGSRVWRATMPPCTPSCPRRKKTWTRDSRRSSFKSARRRTRRRPSPAGVSAAVWTAEKRRKRIGSHSSDCTTDWQTRPSCNNLRCQTKERKTSKKINRVSKSRIWILFLFSSPTNFFNRRWQYLTHSF